MASIFKGVSVNASTGAYVALGTDTNRRDIEVSCTGAAYVVTDAVDASAALTAASAGAYFQIPANVIVRLDNVALATTWIRGNTAACVVSTKYYQPS